MFPLIKRLTELVGPVGEEQAVIDYVEELWRAEGAVTERTRIGNLFGCMGENGPRVLMVAHADELCYLVRAIDPAGFLWLAGGQVWQRTTSLRNSFAIGQRVKVLGRKQVIPGVIGTTTGHLASLALAEPSEWTWDDFWVDTGLSRQELTQAGVTPGTRVVWDSVTEQFGPNVVGKALDDRVLLAVLTEVLRRVPTEDLGCQLTVAATVQEEIGLIGASALAARQPYDAAIILEIGLAGDIPGVSEQDDAGPFG